MNLFTTEAKQAFQALSEEGRFNFLRRLREVMRRLERQIVLVKAAMTTEERDALRSAASATLGKMDNTFPDPEEDEPQEEPV